MVATWVKYYRVLRKYYYLIAAIYPCFAFLKFTYRVLRKYFKLIVAIYPCFDFPWFTYRVLRKYFKLIVAIYSCFDFSRFTYMGMKQYIGMKQYFYAKSSKQGEPLQIQQGTTLIPVRDRSISSKEAFHLQQGNDT